MPTGSASAPDLQQSPAQVTRGGRVLSEITPPPQPKHALTWPQSMELITRVLCYFRLLRHEMAVPKGVANTQGEVTRTVIPAHDGNVARPSPPGRLFFLFECEPWGNSASLSSCVRVVEEAHLWGGFLLPAPAWHTRGFGFSRHQEAPNSWLFIMRTASLRWTLLTVFKIGVNVTGGRGPLIYHFSFFSG